MPLGAFTHFAPSIAPLSVNHQGLFPAVTISFNLAPGVALGDAVDAIEQTARTVGLPDTIHTFFAGTAQAYQDSLANEPFLIAAALTTVYIVLGILYESYVHPITILSTLPSAGVGALLALLMWHTDLSIIAMIGIILLIGIVKKNAIMMIDFAMAAERAEGMSPRDAIYQGLPAALPANSDDHHVGIVGRHAARARTGRRRRAAPAAGNHDHRRADRQPAPDALYYAGGLLIARPVAIANEPRARARDAYDAFLTTNSNGIPAASPEILISSVATTPL